jgi:DNA-binding HxlR family transcriptional regulator
MQPLKRESQDDFFMRWPGSRALVEILADKWTIPILHTLARGPRRPGELRRHLQGVSQKMLTQTLRSLEQRGFVTRTVHAVMPPRVEYALTPLGESLNAPLAALCEWSERHAEELEKSVPVRGISEPES